MTSEFILFAVFFIFPFVNLPFAYLWAQFMPRWNLEDEREHTQECLDGMEKDTELLASFYGEYPCDCPVRRKKTREEKKHDFMFLFLIPALAYPVIISVAFFAALSGAMAIMFFVGEKFFNWLAEKLF